MPSKKKCFWGENIYRPRISHRRRHREDQNSNTNNSIITLLLIIKGKKRTSYALWKSRKSRKCSKSCSTHREEFRNVLDTDGGGDDFNDGEGESFCFRLHKAGVYYVRDRVVKERRTYREIIW